MTDQQDKEKSLIREDKRRRGIDRLESLLLEGLNSGGEKRLDRDEWASLRAEARARADGLRKSKAR